MNLFLKSIVIDNWKGMYGMRFEFGQFNSLYAKNRGGKSVFTDAFFWLLTGKDSKSRENYEIKDTKQPENNRGEHKVEGVLLKDSSEIILTRIFKEVWHTPTGQETPVLKGNTTVYEIQGVPKSAGEYQAFISDLIPEHILKMVTNPNYFPALPWQDQRALITEIAGDVDNGSVLDTLIMDSGNKSSYKGLIAALNDTSVANDKRVNEYKKQINAKILKIKPEIAAIAPKIQELTRLKPQPVNAHEIQNEITRLETEIEILEQQINDKSQASVNEQLALSEIRQQINKLNSKNQDIKFEVDAAVKREQFALTQSVDDARRKVSLSNDEIVFKEREIKTNADRLQQLTASKEALTQKWHTENEKPFIWDDSKFICQTCKRELPADNIEAQKAEMITNYNQNKQRVLDDIVSQGQRISAEIKQIEGVSTALKSQLNDLTLAKAEAQKAYDSVYAGNSQTGIKSPEARIKESAEYSANIEEIARLTEAMQNRPNAPDYTELRTKRAGLVNLLDAEKLKLNDNKRIEELETRIAELKADEKRLGGEIAKLQKEDFAIQQFIVAKVNAISHRVNALFPEVTINGDSTRFTFKLFDVQMNGAINQTCELLVNDVRYGSANTESRLNAGLAIINAISKHYKITAPIIIDNRESVTEIIPVQAQVINLFVSPAHETLTLA